MARMFARRLIELIPAFVGLTLLAFLLVKLAPGEPSLAHDTLGTDAATNLNAWRHLRGDDAPWWQQYGQWLWSFVRFDFGRSLIDEQAVTRLIAQALPTTLLLSGSALIVTYIAGIPLGLFSALKRGSRTDRLLSLLMFGGYSLPSFWLALVLLVVLAGHRDALFPLRGLHSEGMETASLVRQVLDVAWHLVLPVFCLALPAVARTARYQRAAALDVLSQEFVVMARASGLSLRQVLRFHVLPNALLPMLTLLSIDLPWLVGGSVVIERIFTLRGMGLLAFEAVVRRDYPVLMGTTAVVILVTMLALLLGDVALAWADPRFRKVDRVLQ